MQKTKFEAGFRTPGAGILNEMPSRGDLRSICRQSFAFEHRAIVSPIARSPVSDRNLQCAGKAQDGDTGESLDDPESTAYRHILLIRPST